LQSDVSSDLLRAIEGTISLGLVVLIIVVDGSSSIGGTGSSCLSLLRGSTSCNVCVGRLESSVVNVLVLHFVTTLRSNDSGVGIITPVPGSVLDYFIGATIGRDVYILSAGVISSLRSDDVVNLSSVGSGDVDVVSWRVVIVVALRRLGDAGRAVFPGGRIAALHEGLLGWLIVSHLGVVNLRSKGLFKEVLLLHILMAASAHEESLHGRIELILSEAPSLVQLDSLTRESKESC